MKLFLKVTAILMAALMLIPALVACGGTPDTTTPEVTTPEVTTPEDTTPEDTTPEVVYPDGLDVILKNEKNLFITLDLEYEGVNPWSYAMYIYQNWSKHMVEAEERETNTAVYTEEKKSEYTIKVDMTVGSYAGAVRPSIGVNEPVVAEDGYHYVDFSDYSVDLNKPGWGYGENIFRTVETIEGYEYKEDEQLDVYGGYMGWGQIGEKTGFFHTEFINGRWWVIDPLGYPFFRTAINTITPNDYAKKLYGTTDIWAQVTTDKLKEIGVNSVGGWSSPELNNAYQPLTYTLITKTLRTYATKLGVEISTAGGSQFKDAVSPVFNPEFVDFATEDITKQISPLVNDPNVYGWMSDNELEYNEAALPGYLALDPTLPENVYSYAMGWTFMYMETGCKAKVSYKDVTEEHKKEFISVIFDRYFDVVTTIIKDVDPNHMYLGSRFVSGCVKNDYVLKISGLYCDVITYNCYKQTAMFSDVIQKIQNLTNRPFVITEFATAGMDACNIEDRVTNPGGAGFIVRTQADRGIAVQSFILKLMECQYCVGYDYYKYRTSDPDSGADLSNLWGSSAFITHRETEYTDFVERISEVNNAKYSLIEFFDARR